MRQPLLEKQKTGGPGGDAGLIGWMKKGRQDADAP